MYCSVVLNPNPARDRTARKAIYDTSNVLLTKINADRSGRGRRRTLLLVRIARCTNTSAAVVLRQSRPRRPPYLLEDDAVLPQREVRPVDELVSLHPQTLGQAAEPRSLRYCQLVAPQPEVVAEREQVVGLGHCFLLCFTTPLVPAFLSRTASVSAFLFPACGDGSSQDDLASVLLLAAAVARRMRGSLFYKLNSGTRLLCLLLPILCCNQSKMCQLLCRTDRFEVD